MGNSRIIANHKRQVFMAHVCSDCDFPVITVVQIEAEAQKTYTFSRSSAEQIASKSADDAIEYEISRIEACIRTKVALYNKEKKLSMISPGHFCGATIVGFEGLCPYCANLEPWQASSELLLKLTRKDMSELKDINFPIVFRDANKAERWAYDYVSKLIKNIEEERQDKSRIEQATIKSIESVKKIEAWQRQRKSISELRDRETIEHQLQEYKAQKKQLGLLDFKRKIDVSSTIKALGLKLEDVNKIIDGKEKPIITNIKKEQEALLHNQAIAFGCTGNIVTKKLARSFSYHYEPNSIPQELLISSDKETTNDTEDTSAITKTEEPTESYSPKEKDEIIFCRKCGFKLIPDSAFCTKCGAKID